MTLLEEFYETERRWYDACNSHPPEWEKNLCLAGPDSAAYGTPTDIEAYLDRLFDLAHGLTNAATQRHNALPPIADARRCSILCHTKL